MPTDTPESAKASTDISPRVTAPRHDPLLIVNVNLHQKQFTSFDDDLLDDGDLIMVLDVTSEMRAIQRCFRKN